MSPGVYVEEIEIGAKPIEGVSTSTAGFLGETERGPTKPRLITSWLQYQRVFGSYFGSDKFLPFAVEGFFKNGGKRCYIGRIVKKDAKEASIKLTANDKEALTAKAVGEGTWGNRIALKIEKIDEKTFNLRVFYWKTLPSPLFDPEIDYKTTPRPSIIEVYDRLSTDQSSPNYYKKMVNGISNLIELSQEKDDNGKVPGIEKISGTSKDIPSNKENIIILSADPPGGLQKGMWINIISGQGKRQGREITDYTLTTNEAKVDPKWEKIPDKTSKYEIVWFKLLESGTDVNPNESPILILSDYQRTDTNQPGDKKGLTGFAEIDEISIIYSPNANTVNDLESTIIEHCETLKDRFAIIDSEQTSTDISTINPRDTKETKYAAFYYPWIYVTDPESGIPLLIPPGGHVAGIYARTDAERGVHKAPANEKVRGTSRLQFTISKGEQDILNPRGVNCIRAFRGRGIRVWGARTLSSDPLWKYINVRRLFLYLEESIEEGTQWVVFEPNDQKLWARVKQTITQFLTKVWKDGALMGTTPEEAFFVKCDRTTMTQDDIDNGRLIVLIGVAPVKPAEFVIFRIAQWQGGSDLSE